jgi:hypothetical protein
LVFVMLAPTIIVMKVNMAKHVLYSLCLNNVFLTSSSHLRLFWKEKRKDFNKLIGFVGGHDFILDGAV